MIDISMVDYSAYNGGGAFAAWLANACTAAGVFANDDWSGGMTTLCKRESSFKPNAVNDYDSNATGPRVADGYPQNCSRGVAQCIPSTFASHHAEGTSWQIYDPVANIAAAISYIVDHYHVALDGSDLARKVQQADPNRPPHGYLLLV